MNAIARLAFSNSDTEAVLSAARAPEVRLGLGPNQLTWLRRNIDSFKHAEEQRQHMRHDIVRAARIAGLV
ncbi:MAG: hypothetical protein R3D05_14185 [Dongiaceae bacterium]